MEKVLPIVKKGVLITGASSGIGAGLAVHLAELGYKNLSLVARRLPELERVAEKCRAAGADNVVTLSKDLLDVTACGSAVAETVANFGRLDVLICNAGGADWRRLHVRDLSLKALNFTLGLNLVAPFVLTRQALPHLEKTKGNILYMSSVAGTVPFEGGNAYCTAKAALNQLARCVALEEAPNGIRANILSPGVIATPIHTAKVEDEESMGELRELAKGIQPLGRVGEVNEVVKLAAFLVSDGNTFMTGSNVGVDGGIGVKLYPIPKELWARKDQTC